MDNELNGQGKETGPDYFFDGIFRNNRRLKGKLEWEVNGKEFKYKGFFDKNNMFTGEGISM